MSPRLAMIAFAALLGCNDKVNPLACESDAQCSIPGTRCNVETKLCVCTTDEACEDGFFCNNAGVCQEEAGCSTNADCDSGTYCDTASGICLNGPPSGVGGACGLAAHCPFGTICTNGSCAAGCYDEADCPLGQICFQGMCATGDAICSADAFCEYGQRCDDLACVDDNRGPYCRSCRPATATNPNPCDHPRNFCLNNDTGTLPLLFCGVDCSLDQPCPNGYGCARVLIVPQGRDCTNTAQCQCSAPPEFAGVCTIAAPCEPEMGRSFCEIAPHPDCGAGACFVSTGTTTGSCTCGNDDDCDGEDRCVAELCCPAAAEVREDVACFGNEGAVEGFCSCGTDDDCPPDACEGASATCALTGLPCTPGANDCPALPCFEGLCLIGNNCAPEEGLSCSIVAP